MDRGALVTATAIGAAFTTALMACMTTYPLALAPGMGINAYFIAFIGLKNPAPIFPQSDRSRTFGWFQ